MNIKDLLNEEVSHIKLGTGIITGIEDGLIVVEFKNHKISRFQYPAAFRSFLTPKNPSFTEAVNEDLNKWLADSGVLEAERLKEKTAITQLGIVEREEERKRLRIERAKADALKSRFYLNMSNPGED